MTDQTEPLPPEGGDGAPDPDPNRRWWYVAAALAAVLAVLVVLLVVRSDDDDDEQAEPASTTSTTSSTTSTVPEATTTSTPTSTSAPAEPDLSSAIWPFADSAETFTEPTEAARGFATDYLGFTAPVVGDFQQGDSRSGEVPVRPEASGPVTTILVRQLAGDAWYVLGAATPEIVLTEPAASSAIVSPVRLQGSALAFEGNLAVEVRQDGTVEPLGEGFVTGGGDVMRPFDGSVSFDAATEDAGAIVLVERSARDGSVWKAAAVRIRFG